MIQPPVLETPAQLAAAAKPAAPPPPKPSRERGDVHRTRRHQERLVADWLRSLAPRR